MVKLCLEGNSATLRSEKKESANTYQITGIWTAPAQI